MEENKKNDVKDAYKEERFEYAVYVNDFIICKRNFRINNFVEGSMETMEFKYCVDDIVDMIDNDLKVKSRVYLWKCYNPDFPDADEELVSPLIEPWSCTFKFVVYDNKKEVFSKIWDGYAYPRYIREKVDLSNKYVRITSSEGTTFSYSKEAFFETNKDRLTFEQELLRNLIMDRPDILAAITDKIRETCALTKNFIKPKRKPERSDFDKCLNEDFTQRVYYGNGKGKGGKEYPLSIAKANKKFFEEMGKQLAKVKK